jgi:CRP-like cAMP-binding protein
LLLINKSLKIDISINGGDNLINHELYRCLPDEYQIKIVEALREIHLEKGEPLFWEGEKAHYVYYMKKGNLKVYKTSINGQETIFDIYAADSFVALGVLFNDPQHYPASSAAVDQVTVYAIDIPLLEEAIVANPITARRWMSYINKRLTTVQSMLSDQIFADGVERLKKLIQHFYDKYPSRQEGDFIRVNVPITKQEMAELLNVRRETLSRMLSTLKQEDVCECTYKELIVNKKWLFEL